MINFAFNIFTSTFLICLAVILIILTVLASSWLVLLIKNNIYIIFDEENFKLRKQEEYERIKSNIDMWRI